MMIGNLGNEALTATSIALTINMLGNMPMIGLMGIDWGYGFDPPANSTTKSGSQFHFVLGQQF